jgi:eukaryotic-like serine/threonine-protein kinase
VPEELTSGTVLNEDLVLTRPLAEGNGNVWIAEHKKLGADVVVKLLPREAITSPEARIRFTREVRAQAAIDSIHVVKRLDAGVTEDGVPFIALELLVGEDLRTHLGRVGPLAPAAVVPIVKQVASALYTVHRAGIVHRDIKPENVFLCTQAEKPPLVKVLDFGVAKNMKPKSSIATSAGIVVGTPSYMSPEQMTGGVVDEQVDLWALAVLAFETLTGDRPFPGDDLQHIGRAALTGPRPKISSLEPAFAALDPFFARAFAKERKDRFVSAVAMSEAFTNAVASLSDPQVPSSTATRTRSVETFALRVAPRRRARKVVIVVTLLLVLALIIFLVVRRR